MSQQAGGEDRFVGHLEEFVRRGNRGALSALRRALGRPPGSAPEIFPYVLPWVPRGVNPSRELPYFVVAPLFALWHQGRSEPGRTDGNLGRSFEHLARRNRSGREAIERRFISLLGSPLEDIAEHLRHGVSLLRTYDVAVDWAQLARDLRWWEEPEHRVQRGWAREFWGRMPEEETEAGESTEEAVDHVR